MGTCFCDIDHITNHYWAAEIGHCKTLNWPNLDAPSPKILISTHKLTANSIVVQIMSNGITISFVTPILVLSQKKTKYMLRKTHNRPGLVITCTCTYFAMIYSIIITKQMAFIVLYKSYIYKTCFAIWANIKPLRQQFWPILIKRSVITVTRNINGYMFLRYRSYY